jgi:arylsulfatase A-like enzyme
MPSLPAKYIIYLDIDTLRADHLSCYGYHRKTTPNLDAIAAEGARLTNFYCPDSPCLPSRTALFSGRFGINTGVVNHGGTYADLRVEGPGRGFRSTHSQNALGERLRRAGWYTVSISPFPYRHTAYHVWEGFRECFDPGRGGLERADEVWPYVERWLRSNRQREKWFLHVNLWDPHTPYDVPLDYGSPFAADPPPSWLTQKHIDAQRASYGWHEAVMTHGDWVTGRDRWLRGTPSINNLKDFKTWIDGYDTGIHYADSYAGRLVALLKELGLYEQTAIVVSADHGENHGELEVWGDHQTADQFTHNVPLIVRWPGLTEGRAGRAFTGLHYNVDLASTLVELAGGDVPAVWDGVSFAETLRSGRDCGREFLVLSHGAWSCQRSLRWDSYLFIRTYHTGHKNFPSYMLFDLKDDPHETRNLAKERPELVHRALATLEAWVTEQLRGTGQPDPLLGVIADGGPLHARDARVGPLLDRLRQTGRAHHAEWLEKHGGKPRDEG